MFVTLALGILAAIALVAAAVALRPGTFRVERTAIIAAPREAIFPLLSDYRQWKRWCPFEQLDPDMKRTYAGPASGVGAVYSYAGNSKIGAGRMTVTDCRPAERLALRAEFLKPMTATNEIEFTLTPVVDGVAVTWAMSGAQKFVCKLFSLVMSADRMVGSTFENGLAQLKSVCEQKAASGTAA
jgi:uncharacterized protein YndB with AHSA1/START domain